MAEGGLGPGEVSKELAEHRKHTAGDEHPHDRLVSIVEAVLLAVVAVLAAWSGYASAKWSTESGLFLAESSTARAEANRFDNEATAAKNFDAEAFDAWFAAYVADDQEAMDLAERRFRPEFAVAFEAWLALDPANNPDAPGDPTEMPEYVQVETDEVAAYDALADEHFEEGSDAGATADEYVRITIFLATVLFLVGISGHFRVRAARVGLVTVGTGLLVYAVVLLASAPFPP
jgi:hypothetical protein